MWKIKDPEALKAMINWLLSDEIVAQGCKQQMDNYSDYILLSGGEVKIRLVKESFKNVPEYKPDGWNPFPEVNPPECGEYLVTFKDEDADYVQQNYFDNLGKWETAHSDVIAFRALPAPYQPEADK